MTIPFFKYQGAGNDFIMIDQFSGSFIDRNDKAFIQRLCDRRFGVGADGLILLQPSSAATGSKYDFEMVYFNADGSESSLCGNGGRCIVAFARLKNYIGEKCEFLAIDGPHEASIDKNGWVSLKMIDVPVIEKGADYFLLNTGSPHYVVFVEDLQDINVFENGQEIRYSKRFKEEGVNVNFVERKKDGSISLGTYERGVEAETLACGTGATAAAIAAFARDGGLTNLPVHAKGGDLRVHFESTPDGFKNIWLCGPAVRVYDGKIDL